MGMGKTTTSSHEVAEFSDWRTRLKSRQRMGGNSSGHILRTIGESMKIRSMGTIHCSIGNAYGVAYELI